MSTNNPTIGELIPKTTSFLKERGLPNPRLEADLMLAGILDLPRVSIYSQWDRPLEPNEVQRYRDMILKRVQGWPLAYLSGKKAFLSWEFIVTPDVLIPRPETEILIEAIFERLKDRMGIRGADVGTGSGIIAVSLAKLLPDSHWYATDVSAEALSVAAQNAARLGVADRITFLKGDLLDPIQHKGLQLDVILSNPPYIPTADIATLQTEVQKEPRLALDGGPDGLEVYRRLLPKAVTMLAANGLIAMEHGHDQSSALQAIGQELDLCCISKHDLAGLDRILICKKREITHA